MKLSHEGHENEFKGQDEKTSTDRESNPESSFTLDSDFSILIPLHNYT